MPAKSKNQQKFFGMVKSVQQGKTPKSKVTKNVKQVADNMSEKEVDDFASTPTKNLPTKVKQEQLERFIKKIIKEQMSRKISR